MQQQQPQYPNRRPSAESESGYRGSGAGNGGGTIFFPSSAGSNFILAAAPSTSASSVGDSSHRLPRTVVEPSRPQAARPAGDSNGFATANSAWLRWSRERRASVLRRQDRDARDSIGGGGAFRPLLAAPPPTPPPQPPKQSQKLQHQPSQQAQPRKARKGKGARRNLGAAPEPDLSMSEWSRLLAFWQHPVFTRARIVAMIFLLLALVAGVTSVSCRAWSFHLMADNATSAYSGLWDTCFVANDSCVSTFDLPTTNTDAPDWQKSVAALLVSSVLLSAVGSVVALCGFWASYLPRKVYYYHSSGEIFLVSAIIASISVGVYPYSVQRFLLLSVTYGYGYGLGWATAGLQYLAAFAMTLDVLVRDSSRPRPWIASCLRCCRCCRRPAGRNAVEWKSRH